jgi:uncharacterized membrane protein
MNQLLEHLTDHWFAGLLLLAALVAAGLHLFLRKSAEPPFRILSLLAALALALASVGGFLFSWWFGIRLHLGEGRILDFGGEVLGHPVPVVAWLMPLAMVVFFGMLLVVFLSGKWWAPLGYAVAAVLMLGLGALITEPAGKALESALAVLGTLEFANLLTLTLLALVPIVFVISLYTLKSLTPLRRWIIIGLRCLVILLLVLALADVRASQPGDTTVVIFVVDASLSVPEAGSVFLPIEDGLTMPVETQEVIQNWINTMVESREKRDYARLQFGVIYFGAQARLVRSPTDAPRLNVKFRDIVDNVDRNYTNIQDAINLAMASFPEGVSKRIVLLTDGNENLGNVESQVLLAKSNDVQIDVVPLGKGKRKTNEILVQGIEAPPEIEEGAATRIQVSVRSLFPGIVEGRLNVQQKVDLGDKGDQWIEVPGSPRQKARLKPGINTFIFDQPKRSEKEKQPAYSFRAEFTPERSKLDGSDEWNGKKDNGKDPLPGDLKENNSATTHIVASRGKSRILLLEAQDGAFDFLEANLPTAKNPLTRDNPRFDFVRRNVGTLPQPKDLGAFLSGFDCVMLGNLPASSISKEQQEIIKSNTHDQGCGLIMIGGPESYGAGAWQGTPIEEALPVDTNIRSFRVQGKVGLVMIMHASEMAKGNYWQKQIAKTAVQELSDTDEVGILEWGGLTGGHGWFTELKPIEDVGKDMLLARIDKLSPGDMPDFGGALRKAYDALADEKRDLVGRHVIIISDGDPQQTDATVLADMKKKKITVTTIGVATHGVAEDTKMRDIAKQTGGRYHKVDDPSKLPGIYLKETRLITQDFLYEKRFTPELMRRTGPTQDLPKELPDLKGFVRTQPKPAVSVITLIKTPKIAGHEFPILAYWNYGLGKAVAFTSDAHNLLENKQSLLWSSPWFDAKVYGSFWESLIDWAVRPVEKHKMTMITDTRDGRTRVTVVVRDDKGRPPRGIEVKGAITTPGALHPDKRGFELKFEQKRPGVFEAEFKAEEAGSYFINATALDSKTKQLFDSVRGGVSIPYSPEFADIESNTELVENIARLTDGKVFDEKDLQEMYVQGLLTGKASLPDADDAKKLPKLAGKEKKDAEARHDELARELLQQVCRNGPPPSRARLPVWFWLVFAASLALLLDVAIRRVAIEPEKIWNTSHAYWERLRGRAAPTAQSAQFFDRLRSRKAQVGEVLGKARAEKRFEAPHKPVAAPPAADEPARPAAPTPTAAPRPPRQDAPAEPGEEGDYGGRLLRAKKRAQKDREKEQ